MQESLTNGARRAGCHRCWEGCTSRSTTRPARTQDEQSRTRSSPRRCCAGMAPPIWAAVHSDTRPSAPRTAPPAATATHCGPPRGPQMSRRPWLGIRRESDVLAGQRLLGHDLPAFCGQVVDRDVRVNADHTAALRWQDISPERSGPADPSSPTNGAAVRTTPSRASSTTPRPGRWTSRGSACAPSKAEGVKAFDPLIAPFEVTDGLDDRRTPDERRHSDAARGLGELAVTIVPCPRGGPQPVGGGALGSAGFHTQSGSALRRRRGVLTSTARSS